ncbi:MAG: hypothetical protein E7069_12675 [Bacteroidales bacterium]|nr:hypothetical protein [Bacteroidales bacterium]
MDAIRAKKTQKKRLMFYLSNNLFLFFAVLCCSICYAQVNEYKYSDVQGIWMLNYNHKSDETPQIFYNEFYIFNHNRFLIIATHTSYCIRCQENNIGMYEYGFSKSKFDIDTLLNYGQYFVYINDNDYCVLNNFFVRSKDYMELQYDECSYLEHLPKKAQSVLYKRSLHDHRNYAREFLEYDICDVKNDNVHLLDSLQNETDIVIGKDDIVVVRDTVGALLQVEYEPEPDKYIIGYLRREDLQFVETIDK